MKKKILALAVMLSMFMGALAPSGEVFAEGCDQEFLGLRPWYYGLTDESCNIESPKSDNYTEAPDKIATFIWTIILNVLVDVFVVAGVVALGFVIYGGYLYLRSGGDVAFATKGRKTLTAALVGLVIVTLANVISRLIVTVLTSK